MDAETWFTLLERIGFAGVVLLLLAWGLARSCKWIGDHVIIPIVEDVRENMKSLSVSQRKQARSLRKLESGQAAIEEKLPDLCPFNKESEKKNERI